MPAPTGSEQYLPKHVQRRVKYSLLYLTLLGGFILVAVAVYRGSLHLVELKAEEVTIDELPSALALSFFRMLISYVASMFLALALGLTAARTAWGERIIIPMLDILQSIPVVGFFPAAISFFIGVADGHRIGVEFAAIFLILTSQAWNLAFAVYEAVKSIPQDKLDAVASFGIRGSRRFWKLEAPACIPRLVYNSILSWSNGWFFLVACEIIAVGPLQYHLPGIGSFLALAAEQSEVRLILYGIGALTALILFLDFLVWRPASRWSERFRHDTGGGADDTQGSGSESLPRNLLSKLSFLEGPAKQVLRAVFFPIAWIIREVLSPLVWDLPSAVFSAAYMELNRHFFSRASEAWSRLRDRRPWIPTVLFVLIAGSVASIILVTLIRWLRPPLPEIASQIPLAVLASTGRLIVALLISMAWTVPLAIYVWNRPRARQRLTTIAQVGASLPAIALFPLIILVAVQRLGGGMEIASIALLMTGMQWYVLFNSLGGVAVIPANLSEATRSFGLRGPTLWNRLVIPAMRPALITGALTAWGGGWNALVVAEYVRYKDQVLKVNGIGALLNHAVFELGHNRSIMFCIAAMVGWILFLNVVFWRPVYQAAIERYRFES